MNPSLKLSSTHTSWTTWTARVEPLLDMPPAHAEEDDAKEGATDKVVANLAEQMVLSDKHVAELGGAMASVVHKAEVEEVANGDYFIFSSFTLQVVMCLPWDAFMVVIARGRPEIANAYSLLSKRKLAPLRCSSIRMAGYGTNLGLLLIRWLSGWESPLKSVKEGVENRFCGAACSISAGNGEEFTWSTSLRRASSKSPPIFKSQHLLPTWFAVHVDCHACSTYWWTTLAWDPQWLIFVSWLLRTEQVSVFLLVLHGMTVRLIF
ncbi:unnamed protein product [Prunus armeniaca]